MLMVTENAVVINCPVCKRVIWANAACTHGEVPVPLVPAGPDPEPDPEPGPQPKKRRKW